MRKRRQPLVCQYMENLSSAALERYADIIRDIVGRRHGVYALYRRKNLYYVGLASNLRSRLGAHLKDRHRGLWDRFSVYLTIDDRHLKELESLVLRIIQPKGNKHRGKFTRSENLMRELNERVKEDQRKEWLTLTGRAIAKPDSEILERGQLKPILAGFFRKPVTIRAKYKGNVFKARVRRDGKIRINGKICNSPSLAAFEVVHRPMNGWHFWTVERAPGQWVRLKELRRR